MTTNSLAHVSSNTQPPNIDAQSPESMAAGLDFSTIWPAWSEPRKEKVSPARIKSAKSITKRSAKAADLRATRRFLPESRTALVKAAQTSCVCCEHDKDNRPIDCGARVSSLAASVHTVYSAIRTAIVKGYDGLNMHYKDLAKWTALSPRTVKRAVRALRNLRLLNRVLNFANWNFTSTRFVKAIGRFVKGKSYQRINITNSYTLGPAAPKVRVSTRSTPVTKAANSEVKGGDRKRASDTPKGVTERHSNSLPSSERVQSANTECTSHGVGQSSTSHRPTASEGPADRGSVAPNGAQGALTAEAASQLLASQDLGFLDDRPASQAQCDAESDAESRSRWQGALRAAEKGEVAK